MKVIVIEMNNAEKWEEYNSWVSATFLSHREASDWLSNEGFRAEPATTGEHADVFFIKEHPLSVTKAKLVEMDVFGSASKRVANCQDDGWFS